MNGFLEVIIDIVSEPAILVAMIAVLGLVLQKKPASDVVRGGIKTFVGFLVITCGADVIVNALSPFGDMFQTAFNMQGVIPNNEAIVAAALTDYGTATALIMLAGMAFNILIARFTRFKYIYLTGHAMLYMSCMVAVILSFAGMNGWMLILFGGLAMGICNTVFPAMAQPFTRQITKNDTVALGHTGDFGYAVSGLIGKLFGDTSKSTEDIKFPKGLAFLRDSTVSITLTMGIVYIIVALFAGNEYVSTLSGGTNYIVYAIKQAGLFSAGVFVILAGVRLVLAEIVPAFKGISEKLVPNAVPALDCPIVFTYAPNAVLIGFLSSLVGGILSLVVMVMLGTVVIIPGVVPHFFCGATAGVYGNATGGIRGSVLGAFVNGIMISFLPILLMPVMSGLGFSGATFGDTDYGVAGIYLGKLTEIGGQPLVIGGIFAVLAVLVVMTIMGKKKAVNEAE